MCPLFYVPTVLVVEAESTVDASEAAREILDKIVELNVRNFDGHAVLSTCQASPASVDWPNLNRRFDDTGKYRTIKEESNDNKSHTTAQRTTEDYNVVELQQAHRLRAVPSQS